MALFAALFLLAAVQLYTFALFVPGRFPFQVVQASHTVFLMQALSAPCGKCSYYRCSYCGNCHNPVCSSYSAACIAS